MWVNGGIFHWLSIPLSFVLVPVSVLVSHLMTPVIIRGSKEDDDRDAYLNINLSHEMVSLVHWHSILACNASGLSHKTAHIELFYY